MYKNKEHGKLETGSLRSDSLSRKPSRRFRVPSFGHFNNCKEMPRHSHIFSARPQNPAPFTHFSHQILNRSLRFVSRSFHARRPKLKRISLISLISRRFTRRFLHKPRSRHDLRRSVYISISLKNWGGRGVPSGNCKSSIVNRQSPIVPE